MQLHNGTQISDDELAVHMNPGNEDPFGIIHLGPNADLNLESDEDCDRLIRAAARVKAMRARIGTPHGYEPGAGPWGTHCAVCGLLGNSHPEPDATAIVAGAIANGTPVIAEDDPFGPEAYKAHRPGCACPDCAASREDHPKPALERTGAGVPLARCGRHMAMDADGRCDHCDVVAAELTPASTP
jgi:hypothetical protein